MLAQFQQLELDNFSPVFSVPEKEQAKIKAVAIRALKIEINNPEYLSLHIMKQKGGETISQIVPLRKFKDAFKFHRTKFTLSLEALRELEFKFDEQTRFTGIKVVSEKYKTFKVAFEIEYTL